MQTTLNAPAGEPVWESARRYWAIGFLALVPGVGLICSAIVSAQRAAAVRSHPDWLIRENARWAANWNITALIFTIPVWILFVISGLFFILMRGDAQDIITWILLGYTIVMIVFFRHLVVTIIGTVRSTHSIYRPRLTLPFLRD